MGSVLRVAMRFGVCFSSSFVRVCVLNIPDGYRISIEASDLGRNESSKIHLVSLHVSELDYVMLNVY